MKYRPDIDGLRAVAVVSVLLYHVGFSLIPGGFIGVDIFFVISGFLITRIIYEEVSTTNAFDFGRFYTRRARRLFPSLATVIILTSCAAFLILPPDLFQRYGGSVIHTIFSLSNIFFWSESGYFDVESTLKPLLHTWSLSVEEQFYLILPLTLLVLIKNFGGKVALGALIGAAIVSYLMGEFFLSDGAAGLAERAPFARKLFVEGHSSVFFLTPFRLFEFVCGAALVWFAEKNYGGKVTQSVVSVVGAAMVAYGLFWVGEADRFPSYNALIPCLGTALILATPRGVVIHPILRNAGVVWIGMISYTLYLVHWPIITFYTYMNPGDIGPFAKVLLVVSSILIASIIYYSIEKPLRRPNEGRRHLSAPAFGLVCAAVAMALILPSIYVYNGSLETFARLKIDVATANREARNSIRDDRDLCLLEPAMRDGRNDDGSWKCNSNAEFTLLTIGNSHEKHGAAFFRNLLNDYYEGGEINMIFSQTHADQRGGKNIRCGLSKLKALPLRTSVKECAWKTARLADMEGIGKSIDALIVASFKPVDGDSIFLEYANALQKENPNLKIIILGSFVDISPYRCFDLVEQASDPRACQKPELVKYFNINEKQQIKDQYPNLDFFYVSQIDLLCRDKDYQTCTTTYNGAPILVDAHHFSWLAIPLLLDRARKSDLVRELVDYLSF